MIHIALKTEYSFKRCFGHLKDMVEECTDYAMGIADEDNTFGHIQFNKHCKANDIDPIFGVRLRVIPNGSKVRSSQNWFVFLARNDEGLKELYELVTKAYEQFYFFPRLFYSDVSNISSNIISIQPNMGKTILADYKMITPYDEKEVKGIDSVFIDDNFYPRKEDKPVYELLAGARKDKFGYMYNFDNRPCDMHITDPIDVLNVTDEIAKSCDASIKQAEMVKFQGEESMHKLCFDGSFKLGIDLADDVYGPRFKYEMGLIENKGYQDYFLIVADMMKFANANMMVGPSRGSSAGSLVCYLLGITKVDPIKYNLMFERFIDINRFDLPDIDIDFPKDKRGMVIDYLYKKYGKDNVSALANISRLKAKSAIDLFGIGLGIPKADCEIVKNAMIERSGGDARNAMCISDTFNDTLPGQEFIAKYPEMELVSRIENHAQHAGKHAAGIIVSNIPLSNFGSINPRDGTLMLDKRDAEDIDLLKIDCLGLTTLSILSEASELSGFDYNDFFSMELDDKETFKIFNDGRLNGIFQFEGQALKMLTKSFEVSHFDDIVAITALARPGALRSGGAAKFAKRKTGESSPEYFGEKHKEITKETYGIMVFQEQMMKLVKDLANFTWGEISDLRMAASKSLGDDYFGKYEKQFVSGCMEYSNMSEEDADLVWKDIQHSGSWIFNKAHAVAYGMISYYTAYMKAHHPLEFCAACLNFAKDDDSALRILRDAVENDGVEYDPLDPDESLVKWSVVDGKLLGGLTNIDGIGEKKAEQILRARSGKGKWTPSILKKLSAPVTPFDILFPARHHWGRFYDDPGSVGLLQKAIEIRDLGEPGFYVILGKLINRNLNDLNEHNKVQKRGHRLEEDTLYLNIILEDDHDSIMCSIGRFEFNRLKGREIAESANVGKDWFLVMGNLGSKWRGIQVTEILNLTNWSKENES